MLSQIEHVAARGNRCPSCGSLDISGDSVDTGVNCVLGRTLAVQEITCGACGLDYDEYYTLSGYWPQMKDEDIPETIGQDAVAALVSAARSTLSWLETANTSDFQTGGDKVMRQELSSALAAWPTMG